MFLVKALNILILIFLVTWIDHIISTEYDMGNIYMCKIIELDVGNVSDHLPLSFQLRW